MAANPIPHSVAPVLVVSADGEFRERMMERVRTSGQEGEQAGSGAEAIERLESNCYGAVLLDGWLPDLDVGEFVQILARRFPAMPVTVGDRAGTRAAVLTTPEPAPVREARPPAAAAIEPLQGMIGTSARMAAVYRLARQIAPRDTTVMLTGETGTGKELVARAIHALSARARQPLSIVNCAAIPETLLESELFGYARGAFTGAFQSKLGRIHAAHAGTILLDEVGELPPGTQAKLLRFLQEGEVQRLGSTEVFRVDVRIIVSTNCNLLARVADGRFRQDLYYRLAVFPIELPPLRERPEDILPLAETSLAAFCEQAGLQRKRMAPAVCALLQQYAWPGNVRELQHVMERAFVLAGDDDVVCVAHYPGLMVRD